MPSISSAGPNAQQCNTVLTQAGSADLAPLADVSVTGIAGKLGGCGTAMLMFEISDRSDNLAFCGSSTRGLRGGVQEHGNGLVFHMQAARRRDEVPLPLDYIAGEERRLRDLAT